MLLVLVLCRSVTIMQTCRACSPGNLHACAAKVGEQTQADGCFAQNRTRVVRSGEMIPCSSARLIML